MRRAIILWYNKYREKIWRCIGIVVITIVGIQFLEWLWVQSQKKEQQGITISNSNITEERFNSIILTEDKSTVSGNSLSKTQTNSLETLDEFINYCNDNKVNEAYNLLSEDCKNQLYPTVEQFKENYYNNIFSGEQKSISVENWIGDIYRVKIKDNPLSTGNLNTENVIQDYITITQDKERNTRLNINGYIEKEELNIEKEQDNIKIKVVEKHTYMDYETYVFEITNNSDKTVLLNDSDELNTMYLEDKNGIKYYAYKHEISEAELNLLSKETKKINIKYYNKYSSSKSINSIVFSRIILNHAAYINYKKINMGFYQDYGILKINL